MKNRNILMLTAMSLTIGQNSIASTAIPPITSLELSQVCAAAIAIEFGKKVEDVQIKRPLTDTSKSVKVGYVRHVDKTTWNYECKFNLDKSTVIWRTLEGSSNTSVGRWRDGSNTEFDSHITYSVHDKSIGVNVIFSDGSEIPYYLNRQ